MRVVAGSRGGQRLRAPPGRATRPTSDRVREALFSTLGARTERARVLDLFAGSGALGIEALSRGAAEATFVERDPAAVRALRENLERLDLTATVISVRVQRFLQDLGGGRYPNLKFDLVFCDPPYGMPSRVLGSVLETLVASGCLTPSATIVVERDRHHAPETTDIPSSLTVQDTRAYGDTVLYYLQWRPAA